MNFNYFVVDRLVGLILEAELPFWNFCSNPQMK